jgi:hypothetical protein
LGELALTRSSKHQSLNLIEPWTLSINICLSIKCRRFSRILITYDHLKIQQKHESLQSLVNKRWCKIAVFFHFFLSDFLRFSTFYLLIWKLIN